MYIKSNVSSLQTLLRTITALSLGASACATNASNTDELKVDPNTGQTEVNDGIGSYIAHFDCQQPFTTDLVEHDEGYGGDNTLLSDGTVSWGISVYEKGLFMNQGLRTKAPTAGSDYSDHDTTTVLNEAQLSERWPCTSTARRKSFQLRTANIVRDNTFQNRRYAAPGFTYVDTPLDEVDPSQFALQDGTPVAESYITVQPYDTNSPESTVVDITLFTESGASIWSTGACTIPEHDRLNLYAAFCE